MSSEQISSNADLRSTAQDYKREATRKHKWALGAKIGQTGRAEEKPRPRRPSETCFGLDRRFEKAGVASLEHGTKIARRHDMLEGIVDSSGSSDDYDEGVSSPVDAGITYSFDAVKSPSKGSQILNVALAKAVEKFEERETVKLVKSEYDVLDTDGEVVQPSPEKKRKNRSKAQPPVTMPEADDEDYEFV